MPAIHFLFAHKKKLAHPFNLGKILIESLLVDRIWKAMVNSKLIIFGGFHGQ